MKSAPPWDFWGGYTTDAGYWWANFRLFNPVDYFPNQFFGLPAYTQPQSSAWYFPVGITYFLFQEYGPREAALLQAITIFFGACGLYKLGTKLAIPRSISCIGGIAFIFSPGFVANAQHTDIVRGWAFLPWALLFLLKPENKKTLLASTFFWFSLFVGIYPGQIVSFMYICGIWYLLQLTHKTFNLRDVSFVVLPIISGLLFSLVKWIPYLANVGPSENFISAEKINLNSVLTLVYPFRDPIFLGDISMRSYFIVPTILLFLPFARKNKVAGKFLIILVFSILASIFSSFLPFSNISRFPAADFKPGVALSIVVIGMFGMHSFLSELKLSATRSNQFDSWKPSSIIGVALTFSFVIYAGTVGLEKNNYLIGSVSLCFALLCLALIRFALTSLDSTKLHDKLFTVSLIFIASSVIASGAISMRTAPTWNSNIAIVESALWGDGQKSYKYKQNDYVTRPNRVGPDFPIEPGSLLSVTWNGAKLRNEYSSGGYVTYKRQPRLKQILNGSIVEKDASGLNILKRPSTAWFVEEDTPADLQSGNCVEFGNCEKGEVIFVKWSPEEIELRVKSLRDVKLVLNEVSYSGWNAEVCEANGKCKATKVPNDESNFYLSTDITKESSYVRFYFKDLHTSYGIVSAVAGLSSLILILSFYRREEKRIS